MRPLLLLELNEIPWSVAEQFKFVDGAFTRTTVSQDSGELSPWITWPSLHRGMDNTEHMIRHLGQDVRTFRGEPIWSVYRRHGHSVGVCGAMQSWPPVDPGPGGFYIPDTFAHDERCIPASVEPLQRFNLAQVHKNGRVVRPFAWQDVAAAAPALRFVRARTVARAAAQLLRERVQPQVRVRRPLFQTLLFWDVFRRLYSPRLMYASFFTNHIAGVMHRFWGQPMGYALDVAAEMIDDALAWQRLQPRLIVAIASSMGQGPVQREHLGFELAVTQVEKLVRLFTPAPFKQLLAMVPQVAVEMDDRSALKDGLLRCGFSVEETGNTLSITVHTRAGDGFQLGDRFVTWAEAGVTAHPVAAGTGYHIPEGILAVRGAGVSPDATRARMPLREVKSLLWSLANADAAE